MTALLLEFPTQDPQLPTAVLARQPLPMVLRELHSIGLELRRVELAELNGDAFVGVPVELGQRRPLLERRFKPLAVATVLEQVHKVFSGILAGGRRLRHLRDPGVDGFLLGPVEAHDFVCGRQLSGCRDEPAVQILVGTFPQTGTRTEAVGPELDRLRHGLQGLIEPLHPSPTGLGRSLHIGRDGALVEHVVDALVDAPGPLLRVEGDEPRRGPPEFAIRFRPITQSQSRE